MKKIILIVILLIFSCNFYKNFAYDTTAAKYMPLQIGNTWIYYSHAYGNGYNNARYNSYKIIGTADTSGNRYYVFQTRSVFIGGYGNNSCGMGLSYMRIDSISINLYTFGIPCGFYLLDSLKSRLNDRATNCGGI